MKVHLYLPGFQDGAGKKGGQHPIIYSLSACCPEKPVQLPSCGPEKPVQLPIFRKEKIGSRPILFGMDIVVSYSVMKPLRRIDAL